MKLDVFRQPIDKQGLIFISPVSFCPAIERVYNPATRSQRLPSNTIEIISPRWNIVATIRLVRLVSPPRDSRARLTDDNCKRIGRDIAAASSGRVMDHNDRAS